VSSDTTYLAAAVLARHFTRRLWDEQPLSWIEEEIRLREAKGKPVERREYREAEFRSFLPRRVTVFGEERLAIVEPTRRPLKVQELDALLGQKVGDRAPSGPADPAS
jgi:hypothetical protein